MAIDRITVRGARQHNLKDIDVEIPRDRLTVITGLSGSGKSSLAFDTIYAEGQRRYVESLSAYARQFLDQLEKPDVDSVEGLSPAISIEQNRFAQPAFNRRHSHGSLRLPATSLFLHRPAALSHLRCADHAPERRTDCAERARLARRRTRDDSRSRCARAQRRIQKELESSLKTVSCARALTMKCSLDEEIKLDKRRNHTIEAVVDRLLIKPGINERLTESVRTALKLTGGAVLVAVVDGEEKLYSERMACVNCGINIAPLEPRSFNSAYGACKRCHGLGTVLEVDPAKLIPDATEHADKIQFMGANDKQGSAYLKARSPPSSNISKQMQRRVSQICRSKCAMLSFMASKIK
jgi:excinuclease ABC subunit A